MAKAKPPVKKEKKSKKVVRPVVYEKVTAEMFDGRKGSALLNAEKAKELIGWQTEEESGEDFKDDFLVKDREGRKVRCLNNLINRPLYKGNYETLLREMVFKRWKMNCEPIVLTETGQVANGQHQLVGLILGDQDVQADPKRWEKDWPNGLEIPKLVCYGISEDDDTLNSMDTGKERSVTDVLFRSDYLADVKPKLRRTLAPVLTFAVRVLWERTGQFTTNAAYSPQRSIGEMMEFLSRHEKLVKCVRHVWEVDDKGVLSKYVKSGTAAALMYLMACSKTDPDGGYVKARRESKLDFDLYDKARDYFTLMVDNKELKAVRDKIAEASNPDDGEQGITPAERAAIAILGWRAFVNNDKVTAKDLHLAYSTGDDGVSRLVEFPTIGGIDLGPKQNQAGEDEEAEDPEEEFDAELAEMGDDDYSADEEAEEKLDKRKGKAGPKKEKPVVKPKKAKVKEVEEDDEEEEVKPKKKTAAKKGKVKPVVEEEEEAIYDDGIDPLSDVDDSNEPDYAEDDDEKEDDE